MKIFKIIALFIFGSFSVSHAIAQANAYVNILTQNSGQVNVGGNVFIEVTVGNTGPISPIAANKVRAQISVPGAIVSIPATGHILPPGWIITVNTGSAITVCNGSDVIAVGTARTILINVQGNIIGGPSTVTSNLLFSSGTSCTTPGSLPGDNTADNSSTSSIQVFAGCPLAVTASAGTIACNGGTTMLTATSTGSSGTVEYSLTGGPPFQAGNTFTVPAGTYTVTAREVTSPTCIATAAPVAITEPATVPEPTVSIIQPSCTLATGIIFITSSTTGLIFSLDGGTYAIYPASGYIVTAGTHTLTAQNASGCISSVNNIIVNTQPPIPAAPVVGAIIQPTCAISSGSVALDGLPTGNWIINPGAINGNGTSTTVTGLASGTYNFTVTNDASCTSAGTASVIIDPISGVPNAPTINVVQPTCTLATGTMIITSSTSGLTFSLDGGTYANYPVGGYIVIAGAHTLIAQNAGSCNSPVLNFTVDPQPEIPAAPTVNITDPTCTSATGTVTITSSTSGLAFSLDGGSFTGYSGAGYDVTPGNHTLTAQNTNGCISAVTNINVNTQPSVPAATASAGNITCFGDNAILTVTASGGVPPYEYSLDGITFQSGNTFTVAAGAYTITVKGSNPCTTTASITISQPAEITASSSAGNIACNGGATTLTVTASGGTSPYQYSLNGGTFQSANTFTVSAGVQTITIKDASFCTKTAADITVLQPVALTASAVAPWITTCGGTTLVTVTASGGISPYNGTGTYIKGPGTWSFPITDGGGCTSSAEIIVEAPGCIELEVFPNPAKNSITINHSIAEPGSSMQVFEINGALVISKTVPQDAFLTTIDIRRLAAGHYVLVYLNGKDKKSILFEKTNQ